MKGLFSKKRLPDTDYIFAVGKIRAMERFLIKQEVFEEAIESNLGEALRLFAETGIYNAELLHVTESTHLEAILKRELEDLKKLIRTLIRDKRLQPIMEMDKIEDARAIADTFKSRFLSDYLAHLIDMHNIKTFLRAYLLKEPKDRLDKLLACEGFIRRKDLIDLYDKELAAFLHLLEYVHKHEETADYSYYLAGPIKRAFEENFFVYLEKAIRDFLMRMLRPALYLAFGPEPVVAYYFARLNEIELIRMIILAKLNDVPDEILKKRLNLVYA